MASCRAFVFTSEAENLPITLLEAMAAGCPIIANRHCSMPETCGDAVLYADPASAATYGQELERVLWDDELRTEMRHRALQRATRFQWSDAARSTLEALRNAGTGSEDGTQRVVRGGSGCTSNGTA
jgi:glycosyltransferase involved in cell wall biosynthesis